MSSTESDAESQLQTLLSLATDEHTMYLIILALGALTLLLMSALISGSEEAFFSLQGQDLTDVKESESNTDRLIINLLNKPRELLATILIANNLVNIAIVILSTMFLNEVLTVENEIVFFLINVGLVTFLLILLGEVTPKIYARHQNKKMARALALPMFIMVKILMPFSFILVRSSRFFESRIKDSNKELSIEELNEAIELTSDDATSADEKNILKGIVNFGNTSVKQIMKSRHDVVAYDISTSFNELLVEINTHRYSRIPIYQDNFDNVKGILYVKDLIPHLGKLEFKWQGLIRKPYFVPEIKKIDDLLRDFQEKKVHMAIVVDEYGGSQGLVTMEDVLEEIVGEINDEFDDSPEAFYSILDEKTVVFNGKTPLIDVLKVCKLPNEIFDEYKSDVESIGGLVVEIAGKIPEVNYTIFYMNLEFTVEASDSKRVGRVKLRVLSDDLQGSD